MNFFRKLINTDIACFVSQYVVERLLGAIWIDIITWQQFSSYRKPVPSQFRKLEILDNSQENEKQNIIE